MAEIVIGIAASHAPNLAKTSMLRGVDEEQLSRIRDGFARARGCFCSRPRYRWERIVEYTWPP